MEDTDDTVTGFCLHVWNTVDVFRTFTTRLLATTFWPDGAALLGVLTAAFAGIFLQVAVALDRNEVAETGTGAC